MPLNPPTSAQQSNADLRQPSASKNSDAQGDEQQFQQLPPKVSLPKGGGAIRGIGEKFTANPVNGTGGMVVPIATSPGRGSFGPQLSLSYDSGAGNGPFGLGWNLSTPSITRKTDKGLPKYADAEESDTFILSGLEDLVPIGSAVDDVSNQYRVQRYQPRIEGSFARIERFTRKDDVTDVSWRSISNDNVTTWYGKTSESRITDPADASRIFEWLVAESYDDKGNLIEYEYVAENDTNVDRSQANELNRTRTANRYLSNIKYGNTPSRLDPDFSTAVTWHFETHFDYGGATYREDALDERGNIYAHVKEQLSTITNSDWPVRADPLSNYRAGFEIRTYRLCRRVLMFHRFDELLGDELQLVRSTDIHYDEAPSATRVVSISQCGYVPAPSESEPAQQRRYLKKTLPPLTFKYTEPEIDGAIRDVDPDSLQNLPYGFDGANYQWVDLESEGLSGILTEQGDAWYYKRNVAPLNVELQDSVLRARAKFAPLELIATKPNASIANGAAQFMDLAGDGQLDLVMFDGPTPGFYEHDGNVGWESFRAFVSRLNRDTRDANLRFIDLDGDGHADVLITEDEALTWHSSLGEDGFGPAQRAFKPRDEEAGPALIFADGTQSIYLADMSGDGLTDLVRIRNGEVCYWPNLGYGLFGAKVTMDHSPWFDAQDQFEQNRIRLADIDGSGLTDIVYLHGDGVRLYFNQSGNSWSAAQDVPGFPRIDNLSSATVVDLLGIGTACLVWSSPLPGNARQPMKYIDLMSGQKPHLLISSENNLGAITTIEYTPSTRFFLQDKLAGKPWVTRLPFPVHCVSKVTVFDKWRNSTYSCTYSYHHGYFDGIEREFRGFGRVEQIDVESFDKFAAGNKDSPYITDNLTLYQPPVKTITWFHTGASLDRERILSQFQQEYFPNSIAARSAQVELDNVFAEKSLPEPELDPDLSPEEWREALRACKGMTLRQEVYELAVDPLQLIDGKPPEEIPVRLFTAATHNCNIRCLQRKNANRHAVFLVTDSEATTYHYELDLRDAQPLKPDPRVAHALNLSFDDLGNVQQSIAVGYSRWRQFSDPDLVEHSDLINEVQRELHIAYTESHYTNDAIDPAAPAIEQHYRLRVPSEVQTYELTGFAPTQGRYFDLSDFLPFQLSLTLQPHATPIGSKKYHELPQDMSKTKRLVEHARTLFFKDDLSGSLDLGVLGRLGLPYEHYKLALTDDLLNAIFTDGQLDTVAPDGDSVRTKLHTPADCGYISGTHFFGAANQPPSAANEYWMRSGVAGFGPNAARYFYLPENYTDPFDNTTTIAYEKKYHLFVKSSTDALGNTSGIFVDADPPDRPRGLRFDYRVLAPTETVDINGNRSEVYFDVLGRVIALALKGKGTEADNLIGYDDTLSNPDLNTVLSYFDSPPLPADQTYDRFRPALLNATTRFHYHFGEKFENGVITWCDRPAGACSVVREQHAAALAITDPPSPLQIAFECSDGLGGVLMKRTQAEPAQDGGNLRWIVSGKTVLNNKGKPVKQYEPYFTNSAKCCAEDDVHEEVGVTPLMYYDAVGRLIRTELPDGTLSRVEFSPWFTRSFDANDTVLEPSNRWYAEHTAATATIEDKRAAGLATVHSNTPAETHLDSLGREAVAITHNRIEDAGAQLVLNNRHWRDERYATFTRLDTEGKPLWIRDARGNLVMQYLWQPKPNRDVPRSTRDFAPNGNPNKDVGSRVPAYDIAGNLLFQHSMDAGDRWMLTDSAGKPMFAWDQNDRGTGTPIQKRFFFTKYDELHRPTGQWLKIDVANAALVEAFEYRDTQGLNALDLQTAQKANLIGQAIEHWDPSGLATVERIDLCGKPAHVTRVLIKPDADGGTGLLNWPDTKRDDLLEDDTFRQLTQYDALGRITTLYDWHRDITFATNGAQQATPGTTNRVAVYEPSYNERGALASEWLHVRATKTTDASGHASFQKDASRSRQAIKAITYNEKGQKLTLKLGNDTTTTYTYEKSTFRLTGLQTQRTTSPKGVQSLQYVYDPVGNITFINDAAQEIVYRNNTVIRPEHRYAYDALYRLIEATGRENPNAPAPPRSSEGTWPMTSFPTNDQPSNYTQTYAYDAAGNFVQIEHVPDTRTGWTRHYTTKADSNRLDQTWYGNDTVNAVTYRHDAHGNVLNLNRTAAPPPLDPEDDWGLDIRWDWRDMIMGFDCIGGGLARYHYGIDKQRTRKYIKRNGSVIEDRIYLGGYELYRRSNTRGVVEETESHHLFEGGQRVLMVDDVISTDRKHANGTAYKTDSIFRYQYCNHLGSASLELDDQTKIISYEEYHPFGTSAYRAMNADVEAPPKRYRYTGMERDEESGLGYHAARHYAPWLAQWTSADPLRERVGLNLYAYCLGNPVSANDTTGNAPKVVGHVYHMQVRIGNLDVNYVGSAIDAYDRLGPNHPYAELLTYPKTKLTIYPVKAEPNISLSGRKTELSAYWEALRGPEQSTLSRVVDLAAEQNFAAGPEGPFSTTLNNIKAAEDPAEFSSRHGSTLGEGQLIKAEGAGFDRELLRASPAAQPQVTANQGGAQPVGASPAPVATPPAAPPPVAPPPAAPPAASSPPPSSGAAPSAKTTITIPSEPPASFDPPATSKGSIVAAGVGNAAAIYGPIAIKAAGEAMANARAAKELAAQADAIKALLTPTTGVLAITLKRTTLEGDPTAGNVSVSFVSVFLRGGFATPEEAISAVERTDSLSQNIQASSISSSYTWYPPLGPPKRN